MKVLLSIKPKFVEEIFSGKKKFEYRTVIFTKPNIHTIIIYASSPVCKVLGEFKKEDIISGTPREVWQKIKKQSGYSLEEFLYNYKGRKLVNAIKIGKFIKYRKPRSLQKYYNIARAPQNFMYIPRIKH